MAKFTYVELFAGIGGFRKALDSAGGKCIFASEIDKFAQQAYAALYGDEHLHGDITKINEKDVPDHDVLVGGFPCQAFSVSGKQLGLNDTRGTLFFEIARIMKEKQPKIALLENVKGLVGHDKGNTLSTFVKVLNDIGYAVDFDVVNSKYFGVPQNRERIYIVAMRKDIVTPEPWNIPKERKDVVAKGKRKIEKMEGVITFNFDYPKQAEVTTRLRDILEDDVDEKYFLSEEKTAKLVAKLETMEMKDNKDINMLGLLDMKGNDTVRRVYASTGISPTLTTMGGGHREPKVAVKQVGNVNPSGKGMNGAVYDVESGLSPTITTNKGEGPKILEEVRPVLTPDRTNKRQNGRQIKDNEEEAFTLTAQDRHGVAIGFYPVYRIRKLTPLECWRLQGFSDDDFYRAKYYTEEEAQELLVRQKKRHTKRNIPKEKRIERISNAQLYKQAGNAVTVNVVEALMTPLLKYV